MAWCERPGQPRGGPEDDARFAFATRASDKALKKIAPNARNPARRRARATRAKRRGDVTWLCSVTTVAMRTFPK